MDLFDEAFGSFADKHKLGPHEGVAGVLLCAAACDGHIADEEVQSLLTTLGRMKLYQRTTPQQFNSMMDRLLGLLKRGGPEKMLDDLAPVIPPELNECVFANACNIVLADGVVEADEREFLGNLMNKLELDKDRSLKIIKVMVIKNKG